VFFELINKLCTEELELSDYFVGIREKEKIERIVGTGVAAMSAGSVTTKTTGG
jgi:hypothetical protein